jgi:hypothetical protein
MAQILCPQCGQTFKTQRGLWWHVERLHPGIRQGTLAQDRPGEAGGTWPAGAGQLQEELAELRAEVEMAIEKQAALERKMDKRVAEMAAETKDKLEVGFDTRLFDALRERLVPLEQRLNILESERGALKIREDSQERRLDSLDKRVGALEPKREVCSFSRKPRSCVRQ